MGPFPVLVHSLARSPSSPVPQLYQMNPISTVRSTIAPGKAGRRHRGGLGTVS
ncbi:predicted protein [Plenodomus lingam JN3]|uniref:Predicted protein n=1 Tax=Leptosphaeria maculans (strain JN3 / isolate v23.1.3 / race Av1-4-5-6-7-8) TaxID=985895 RepID=E5ABN0_LEPMJ|nr:predicted protein [Plenodomus lingam JN3]CBY01071.1 predicted protein [Plenodomus lingam JN3]